MINNNKIQSNNFKFKYSIEGNGFQTVLVIGSAIYYPKTFSQDLRKKLKLVFVDHRGFAEYDGAKQQSRKSKISL